MNRPVNINTGLVISPQHYDQVQNLVMAWWHRREQRDLSAPATKKAEELQRAKKAAFKVGICAGLASIANDWRCQMFDKWDRVPLLQESAFYSFLDVVEEYMLQEDALPGVASPDTPTDRELRLGRRQQWIKEEFTKIALPTELDDHERTRHEAAVLNGTEEATEADKEWLTALRDERLAAASQIAGLIKDKEEVTE